MSLILEFLSKEGRVERIVWDGETRGLSLIDLFEEKGVTLPYGCRVGSCGTCTSYVEVGMDLLEPKGNIEKDTTQRVAKELAADCRLPCRIGPLPGAQGSIRLKKY